MTLLQLIITWEELKKISISNNYGEVKNSLILTNEEEKKKFISLKRKEYSAFKIPEEEI